MKVLVTGASGFTGSQLARQLSEQGHDVRVLVRPNSNLDLLRGVPVEKAIGDLADEPSLRAAVQGVARVYHLAAVYREAKLSDRVYYDVNVEGTRRLAVAALAEGGVPFFHCSTCGVHGEVSHPPVDESAPYNPGDIYQQTKVQAEELVLGLYRNQGLPVVVLRPVGIYGPGDRRFLKLFRGIARGRFPMIGDGRVLYHMTHVDDVARGFLVAGDTPAAFGEAFILAGDEYTTVGELVERIARVAGVRPPRLRLPSGPMVAAAALCESVCRPLGVEPPLHRRRLDFFLKDRAFRADKARRVLGWAPEVGLDEGIRQTLTWYRSQGWL